LARRDQPQAVRDVTAFFQPIPVSEAGLSRLTRPRPVGCARMKTDHRQTSRIPAAAHSLESCSQRAATTLRPCATNRRRPAAPRGPGSDGRAHASRIGLEGVSDMPTNGFSAAAAQHQVSAIGFEILEDPTETSAHWFPGRNNQDVEAEDESNCAKDRRSRCRRLE